MANNFFGGFEPETRSYEVKKNMVIKKIRESLDLEGEILVAIGIIITLVILMP